MTDGAPRPDGVARSGAGRGGAPVLVLAVVVQRMRLPDVAGVLFTAGPVSGRRGRCRSQAVAPRGEVPANALAGTAA